MIELFGEQIPSQLHNCSDGGKIDSYINLYVKLGEVCNARCKFCKYFKAKEKYTFDKYKFFYVLNEITKKVPINKVSFTGGEPTHYSDELIEVINMVHEFDPNIQIIVSTNGFKVDRLVEVADKVSSFAISRHHWDEDKNCEIFGTNNVPTAMALEQFVKAVGSDKVHITCNLMKSNISTLEGVYKFLSVMNETTGAVDFGFVGLMKLNVFCEQELINIKSMSFADMRGTIQARTFKNKNICCCSNYLTTTRSGDIVKFYVRQTFNHVCENMLVYQDNCVTLGFAGKTIFS